MNHDTYDDNYIQTILQETKTIAVVGASPKPERDSNRVTHYLIEKGYQVFPVNPGHAGREIAGQHCYASLKDIPQPIHMIDVFRKTNAIPGVLEEVMALAPLPLTFWLQLGIRDDESAKKAEALGIKVVMNRCTKIEYARLGL